MPVQSSIALLLGLAIVLSLAPDVARADKDGSPGADVVQIRAFLERRQFVQLTALLKSYQAHCEKNVRWELAVLDGFNVFAVAQPIYKDLLDEWVQSAPENWVPLLARANYFISQGWRARGRKLAKDTSPEQFRRMEESFRLALPDIEAALRINARLFYAYLLLTRINRSAGDQERGTVLVQKALEVSPDSYLVRAYHMVLLSPRWGGSYEAMQEFAAESLLHAAKNPLLRTLMGMVWADQADTERQDPRKAVALGEKSLTYGETWDSLYSLAWAYYRAQIYDKALATVERAVALYPSLPDHGLFAPNPVTAQGLRSRILFRQEKWDAALEALQIMQQNGARDTGDADELRRWEGSQLVDKGHAAFKTDLGRAIELYTLALRFDPDNAKAYCWRGIAYQRSGQPERALNDLQQAIAINPHLYEAYKGLDDLLLKQGRLDEIIAAWDLLLQLEPDNAKAHLERGGTYYRKRDLAAALQDAKRACELGHEEACRLVQRLQK